MQITRRNALMGATAAAVVTGAITAPLAAQADDAILLARIEQSHEAYDAWNRVWEKQQAHRAMIKARLDCPPPDPASLPNKSRYRCATGRPVPNETTSGTVLRGL